MSIPTNSIGPAAPTGSSNPVSMKGWFNFIVDWIKGLSPVGATVYDTGWVACSSPNPAFNASGLLVRRIGKHVQTRGSIVPTTTGTYSLTSAFATCGQLPAGFFPDGTRYPIAGATTVATQPIFSINAAGLIEVRAFIGAPINITSNTTLSPNTAWTVA